MKQTFELVETVTKDKLIHQGIVAEPTKSGRRAILWVHGLTGRFYGDVKLMNLFAEACTKRGMAFASFNNRGHDVIASIRKQTKPGEERDHVMMGAGLELFEQSVFDIDAGISFLVSRGYAEVIVAGHSTGANKACYYAGNTNDPRVAGIVLAGPMSDRLSQHTDKKNYEENVKLVDDLIKNGRGEALITKAHWFPITADRARSLLAPNTNEDVFNYGDTKNVLPVFHAIQAPVLVVLSEHDETADRPVADIQKVFDAHAGAKNYRSVIIPNTTHGYEGKEKEFVDTVADWSVNL